MAKTIDDIDRTDLELVIQTEDGAEYFFERLRSNEPFMYRGMQKNDRFIKTNIVPGCVGEWFESEDVPVIYIT